MNTTMYRRGYSLHTSKRLSTTTELASWLPLLLPPPSRRLTPVIVI
jgi:hypothetical protein